MVDVVVWIPASVGKTKVRGGRWHLLVQALHDVWKGLDMAYSGLLPVPIGKIVNQTQITGVGDAAFAPCIQRIFQ